jgi:hypothetical protein
MCAHLQKMGCEEGKDVYNDSLPGETDVPNQSCTDFHKGLQESGIFINPKCVLKAPSCGSIEVFRSKSPEDC